jgi:hypothetical protein
VRLAEGLAELEAPRFGLATAGCAVSAGGGEKWSRGLPTGVFIGPRGLANMEQQPDHNRQRNRGLLEDLARNRMVFYFR